MFDHRDILGAEYSAEFQLRLNVTVWDDPREFDAIMTDENRWKRFKTLGNPGHNNTEKLSLFMYDI